MEQDRPPHRSCFDLLSFVAPSQQEIEMTAIKLALCAAVLAVTLAAPAEAGNRRAKLYKPQQVVWVPLFLGVGY
jgi:hypothetical protein